MTRYFKHNESENIALAHDNGTVSFHNKDGFPVKPQGIDFHKQDFTVAALEKTGWREIAL